MRKLLLYCAFILLSALCFQKAQAKKCTGSSRCTACTTCNYCKHCNGGGGTCSVCGGGEEASNETNGPSSGGSGSGTLPWLVAAGLGGYILYKNKPQKRSK